MARRKVKLAFITNITRRRAVYQKRKEGLMKKVSELCILCGIDACAIVYNPFDSNFELWPNPSGVHDVIERYKNLPHFDQHKKMLDQHTFLMRGISELIEKINKKSKENHKKEITDFMNLSLADNNCLKNLMPEDKKFLEWNIDQKLKEVTRRIEDLKKEATESAPASAQESPFLQEAMPTANSEMLPAEGIQGQGQELTNPLLPGTNPEAQFMQGGQMHISPMASLLGEWGINPSEIMTNMPFSNVDQISMWPTTFNP